VTGYLFDENLPNPVALASSLPLFHVTSLGEQMSDSRIWDQARESDLAIVTKDGDFAERIRHANPPPRVVLFATGNLKRSVFLGLLERIWPQIELLVSGHKLVTVHRGGLLSTE
jgi:predicted nuclease of predicted toxin-antitoxin system